MTQSNLSAYAQDHYKEYKFRAHNIGNIMGGLPKPLTAKQEETYDEYTQRRLGNGKALTDKQAADWGEMYHRKHAKPVLNEAAKKWLEKLVWQEITGRSSDLQSKYLDKGIQCEDYSLTLYSEHMQKLFIKNTHRRENDFFTGECDISDDNVKDIKTSWSFETFPMREHENTNKMYAWQLDVYMDLFEKKDAELIYCLVDTPAPLIDGELRSFNYKHSIMDMEGEIKEDCIPLVVEMVSNHIYTTSGLEDYCEASMVVNREWFADFREIPAALRIKVFKQEYSAGRNEQLKHMVKLARDYMGEILADLLATMP